MKLHGARLEFPVAQQVRLIRAQVVLIQLVWRPVEMLGEAFNRLEVVLNGGLGVVPPLEFLQHRLSEMGHRNLLVTHTLPDRSAVPHAERPPRQRLRSNAAVFRSVAPAAIDTWICPLNSPARPRGPAGRLPRKARARLPHLNPSCVAQPSDERPRKRHWITRSHRLSRPAMLHTHPCLT
jgi:hypothetical protein